MKQWRCTVCGYIHHGENPPERCPICGASKDRFQLIQEGEASAIGASSFQELQTDILVVGSGAAAFAAAITACSRGASVIMLEKAAQIGGTTARSGGGFWVPGNRFQRQAGIIDDRENGLRYMARYSYPHLYNPAQKNLGLPDHEYELIVAHYDNGSRMAEHLVDIGALDVIVEINWTGQLQVDYMDHLPENKGIRGRSLYPRNAEGKLDYGTEMIRQFETWARANGIGIVTQCEVQEIICDENGRVTGLKANHAGQIREYRARLGVIFGSGGYSHNPELMLRFQRGPHYGGCSVPTNTGDFIRMAGRIGAQIGNMAGAFRAQSMIEAALTSPGGSSNLFYIGGDSVIVVNKYGKRVLDEKRNYTDRAMQHFVWDPQMGEWSNMLMFLLFDQRTATLWQGFPPYPVQGERMPFIIEGSDWQELQKNIEQHLTAIAKHTGSFQLDPSFAPHLQETIRRFNGFAQTGKDLDFQRGAFAYDREWTTFPPTVPGSEWPPADSPNYTMYPLSEEGPYYAVILAAGTLDTNGGPVVNGQAQVLDWQNRPIAGLYGAGNCIASPTANAYWGAGSTIGPGMTFGYLAALHATDKLR